MVIKISQSAAVISVAVVVGVLSFAGGVFYEKHQNATTVVAASDLPLSAYAEQGTISRGSIPNGAEPGSGLQGSMMGGGYMGGRRGGLVAGQIVSLKGQTLEVQLQDGTTKTITVSDATTISATNTAALSDLTVGKSVLVTGSTATDGSVDARSIQIRPAADALPSTIPVQ